MGWVKIRVPRTSQPQDTCGIDWNNPITQNLIVAVLAGCNLELVSGVPLTNYPSNGVGKNGRHLSQSALNLTQMFLGSTVSIPAGSDITGFAVLNESVLRTNNNHGFWRSNNTGNQYFLLQANTGLPHIRVSSDVLKPTSGPAIDFTAPDNRIFFRLKSSAWADYGFDGKSVNYATHAQATPACNVTSIGTAFTTYNALGNTPLLLMFRRTLSDDDVKSLTDNPWQIFEPEELTIWVPGEVGAGGPATVIPIGVQANSAIGTPAAIGSAIAALTGVSATGSVGSPTATGGASIPATASPSGVSASSAVGTPAAKGAAKALPAGVQATSAVGTPLVIGGSSIPATVLPAGVAGLAYVGSPVATGQARAYPLGVQATGAVGSPVVTAGGSAVAQPQGVAASSSVGAPVARGAAVAYPLGLAGYWSVGQPVAIGQSAMPATAYPAGVSATGYVGTPVAFEASDATPSIHRATSPAQSYTATSPAQSYTAVVPAQIYST